MIQYYRLTKIIYDNDLELGLIFNNASGKTLDRYANIKCDGLRRKQFLFFKEPDLFFKGRILEKEMIDKGIIKKGDGI